jgi:exodeoxyribonuclease V gamma subunit
VANEPKNVIKKFPQIHTMTLKNGIAIIHGNKLESLVDVVEYWIQAHPLSPLDSETFLIYNNGVGQWLKQHLAQNSSMGIASGLEVKLPSMFVWEIYRTVLGQQIPKEQPLAKHPLTWRAYRLLPTLIKKPEFENLAHFLEDDEKNIKKHQLAEKLADLFDQYQMYRADWLLDWEKSHDVIRDGHGKEMPLPKEQTWQAKLWRDILQDLNEAEKQNASRSSVHDLFLSKIETLNSSPANLPKRIIVFGIPTLAQQHIEVLAKISQFCQVVLFVTNPCQYYWADIIEDRDLLKAESRRQKSKGTMPVDISDDDLHLYANPLLASWGKQGRDYIRLLDQFDERNVYENWNWANDKIDLFENHAENENACLLHKLQQTILDLEPIPTEKIILNQSDNSIAFHIAHSPQREIEILHDQLLARFNENTDVKSRLKPRDVLVMVPDINKYAPHIHAVFGQIQPNDKRNIPYSVTDQQERGHNSLVVATEFLLGLPHSRFTVSQIRWLLEIPAIRNCLGIEESVVPKLCQWIEGAQIRWGLNGEHRNSLGMTDGLDANTWKFGLNRMLLGYAVGNGEAFANIEPYEEIGGLDAQWLGNLCFLIDLLEKYAIKLNDDYGYEEWSTLLKELLVDFFKPNDDKERKTLESLQSALTKWELHCKQANLTENDLLSRNVVCDSWLSGVDEASFQKIFLSGKVNFCTLMPMRSIPFSVICVLGMNDGEYPRQTPLQSFDLMSLAGQYRPGDRSRRQDDQYVFLEALLSARKQFYVSWIGRDVRDNNKIPPSVLISQLRETIERTWQLPDKNLLDEITLEHPLQPFSKNYLESSEYPRLFTYSHEWFADINQHDVIYKPTENETIISINLETLGYFLKNPVKMYCNQTLKFYFGNESKMSENDEPFHFNSLEDYKFKDKLLSDLKNTNQTIETFFSQEKAQLIRKGQFPLGNFAELSFEDISKPIQQSWERYNLYLNSLSNEENPQQIEMNFEMDDGVTICLSGYVQNLKKDINKNVSVVSIAAQKLKDKPHNLCQHWIKHLAMCAYENNVSETHLFGVDTDLVINSIDKDQAKAHLKNIVAAWYQNRNEVLPIAIKSVFAYLKKFDLHDAKTEYEDKFNGCEIEQDLYLKRIFSTFEELTRNGEFEKWATLLYLPIQKNAQEVKK